MNRTEFRLNRTGLLGSMVLAAAGAMPVHAATLAANPLAADGVAGDAACSLREAVLQVNAGADSADCVNSAADAYGSNDTITLVAGTYNLTVTGLDEGYLPTGIATEPYAETNTPDATKGDLDLMKSVRIVGAGADATIIQWDASVLDVDRDRIFHIFTTAAAAAVNAAIEGLTIQGGRTFEELLASGVPGPDPLIDPALYDFYFRRAGAGLAVGPAANVAKIDPALTGSENSAGRGGSQRPDEPDEGGATFSLTLTGVKILANQAQGDGAGIYSASPMIATNIVVSGNTTTVNGGGIYNEGDTTITNSTISANRAEGGGGVFLTGSNTVQIAGTTMSGNRAIGGGAVSGRSGVAISMVNSTLSGNLGDDVGAGFYHNGSASLSFVTIANNIAGADSPTAGSGINTFPSGTVSVSLKNVLLVANRRGWDPVAEPDGPADPAALTSANCGSTSGSAAITSVGNNLSSDATCALTQATDIRTDPALDPAAIIDPLGDYGGPTQTHQLAAASPALGKGGSVVGITVDQRGVTRDTPPDIGAFELVTGSTPTASGGGGGCAIGSDGRLDPTLPAMLAAALAFLGWRRRAAK
jgi:predicted outer membrane repeat protein